MPSIEFATGLKTFDINGDSDRTVSFCPTDIDFIRRLYGAFEELEKLQGKYKDKITDQISTNDMFELISSTDQDIRGIIDRIFDAPVSEKVFGKLSSFALADGAPIWAGFLIAVMTECDAGFVSQTKAENPKLQKLLGKYKK